MYLVENPMILGDKLGFVMSQTHTSNVCGTLVWRTLLSLEYKMWNIRDHLAVQNRSKLPKVLHYDALPGLIVSALSDPFDCVDPADISHGGFDTFDIELILEADWHSVKRPKNRSSSHLEMVQLLSPLECLFEENLMETIILFTEHGLGLTTRAVVSVSNTYYLMCNCRSVAKCQSDLFRGFVTLPYLPCQLQSSKSCDLDVCFVKKGHDEFPRDITSGARLSYLQI